MTSPRLIGAGLRPAVIRRGWRIRTKLILLMFGLQALMVSSVGVLLLYSQRRMLREELARSEATLREEVRTQERLLRLSLRRKGEALASSIAMAIRDALAENNLTFVLRVAQTTVANDTEVAYVLLVGPDGRVLISTDPTAMGLTLPEAEARRVVGLEHLFVREVRCASRGKQTERCVEIAAPFDTGGRRYLFRLGMRTTLLQASLAAMQRRFDHQLLGARRRAAEQLAAARNTALGILGLSLLLAAVLGLVVGGRLSRPIGELTEAVRRLAERQEPDGQRVAVRGASLEIAELAERFHEMQDELRARALEREQHLAALEAALDRATEASRSKSEFLAAVSHELRTPLNAVINIPREISRRIRPLPVWTCERCGAKLAGRAGEEVGSREDCPDCGSARQLVLAEEERLELPLARLRHLLLTTQSAGQGLFAIIDNLLDFSRLESAAGELHREPIPVARLLEELERLTRPASGSLAVPVRFPTVDASESILVDRARLRQALLNLIGNAVKFSSPEGRVEVRFARNEGAIAFEVEDTGVGIPEAELERIFDGFHRLETSHARGHGGLGLGLAITRRIVELHGGRILVESTVGEGSCFRVELPQPAPPTAGDSVGGEPLA